MGEYEDRICEVPEVTDETIENHYNKIKNLKYYKQKSKEELLAIAKEKLLEKRDKAILELEALKDVKDDCGFASLFEDPFVVKEAVDLYQMYSQDFVFDTETEKTDLKDLVWYEVQLSQLKKEANKNFTKKNGMPKAIVEQMGSLSKEVMLRKDKLGVMLKKDLDESFIDKFKKIRDKCEAWAKVNGLTRTMKCAHCGQMNLLRMRTDRYSSVVHPFFPHDNIYYNKALFKFLATGVLTKEQVAEVLNCNVQYIDWLLRHHPEIMPKLTSEFEEKINSELKNKENLREKNNEENNSDM